MKFPVFNQTVEITGSTAVAEYLISELSAMQTSTKSPDVAIDIESGFDADLTDGLTGGTKVTDGDIIIDRRNPVPVRGMKDMVHNHVGTLGRQLRISSDRDCVDIEIRYDDRITDHNVIVQEAFRSINRSYIYRFQNLAKVILYNDIEPLIHQFLLDDGAGFIHASCVSRNGSGLMISGWGGAGKTSTATKLIENGEWEFVSDDLCLVSSDGVTQPYLKRIQMYPYNISSKDEQRFFEGASLRNRINWRLRSSLLGEKSVRRRVSPNNRYLVSDQDKIEISTLVYLIRENRQDLIYETEELNVLAERAVATIAHEYETHICDLRPLAATHPGVWPSEKDFLNRSKEVFRQAFDSATCRLVRIPQDTTPVELTKYIRQTVLPTTSL